MAAGVITASLPWHTKATVGELKFWISGFFVLGALATIIGNSLRGALTQQVTVDPNAKTVTICKDQFLKKLRWQEILGVQLCYNEKPGQSEMNGYQVNLVWKATDGTVKRYCLFQNALKRFAIRLAREYEAICGFKVIDHTGSKNAASSAKV